MPPLLFAGLLKRPRVAAGGISEEAMLRIANEEDTKRADAGTAVLSSAATDPNCNKQDKLHVTPLGLVYQQACSSGVVAVGVGGEEAAGEAAGAAAGAATVIG